MLGRTLSLVLLFVLGSLARGETFVYISVAAEKRIAVYQLDGATGKLTHTSDCQVADGEPGALTVDPEKRFLLAAVRSTGKLASFRLDVPTGKLAHLHKAFFAPLRHFRTSGIQTAQPSHRQSCEYNGSNKNKMQPN